MDNQSIINFILNNWALVVSLILGTTVLVYFAVRYFLAQLIKRVEKSHLVWDSAVVKALTTPVSVFIWVSGLLFVLETLTLHFEKIATYDIFSPFRDLLYIIIAIWFALRFISNVESDFVRDKKERKKKYDKTTVRATAQISRIFIVVVGALVFLQSRNVPISTVLAFGGAGGLIVGLAAKDLLSNFFGGLIIYLDRPFAVGDRIRSPEKPIEGFVENIGWRLTRIRTLDRSVLYVPNGIFSNICVENPSRMSNRRIKASVGVRYSDAKKVRNISVEAEQMIREHSAIDKDKLILVSFDEFGSSSLNLLIMCFTKTTNITEFKREQEDIFLKIIDIIEKNEAECAFPTTTVHTPDLLTLENPS